MNRWAWPTPYVFSICLKAFGVDQAHRFLRYSIPKLKILAISCFHSQGHTLLCKWLWRCTTTELENSYFWTMTSVNLECTPAWFATTLVGNRFNTLRPRQNGRHFSDDIFKCIFVNENVWISIEISLKFVPKSPINNIPASVQIMAWRRPGDNPLSGPRLIRLPTHMCVTQWVKGCSLNISIKRPSL